MIFGTTEMASDIPNADAPAAPSPRWGRRIALVLILAFGVPLGVSLLYAFPPSEYRFYPPCLVHLLLGIHCPGCGATRSLHALLTGNVPQAFAYNPLFVLAIPFLAYAAAAFVYETWTGARAANLPVPAWALKALIVALIAYFIARNVDVYPFTLLAPHEI
jgi:Protein of unknown function (DUF2752)